MELTKAEPDDGESLIVRLGAEQLLQYRRQLLGQSLAGAHGVLEATGSQGQQSAAARRCRGRAQRGGGVQARRGPAGDENAQPVHGGCLCRPQGRAAVPEPVQEIGDDQLQLRRLWHASALRPYGEGGFGEGPQQTVTEAVASGSVVEGVEAGGLQGRARGGRRYRGRGGGPGIRVLGDELAEQPGARTISTALVIVFGVPGHGRSGEFGDSGRHSVGPGAR
ncbi:hypothetical protein ACFY3M_38380 [Streptomyces mirabilis]|uniref:hypothetical protein n=1 Tax=Streptomyces mirabilis TaxID=68239 RepID=UPI00368B25F6